MSSLLSDERLVRRAAGGEERAFAAIFDRYHQPLYRYCLAIVGDSQDAQDALQNTMLKVLRALPGEGREIKLKPWLYRIAHNESIDLLRRRRDTRELDADLIAQGPPLVEELSLRERLRRLLSDLDELPERQRGALVMRELAGLDFDGIATALGTSPAVARQTLYEARLSLHQMDEGWEMDCATVTQALSDGDGRVSRRRDIRAHLRDCASCRRFGDEIAGRRRDFTALPLLPLPIAAGLLHGLLGGAGGGGSAATGAAIAGGATKSIGSSAALKGAAAILAIAAIGTGAADRGGLIDLGLPGDGESSSVPVRAGSSAGGGGSAPAAAEGGAPAGGSERPAAPGGKPAGVSARNQVGQSVAGDPGQPRTGEQGHGEATSPTAAATSSPAAHPHGKGHEKQLPAASSHGQETAAANKNGGKKPVGAGEGSSPGAKPGHPSHPTHPAHPSHPGAGGEKAPAEDTASPAEAKGKSAAQGGPSAEEASAPGEAGDEP